MSTYTSLILGLNIGYILIHLDKKSENYWNNEATNYPNIHPFRLIILPDNENFYNIEVPIEMVKSQKQKKFSLTICTQNNVQKHFLDLSEKVILYNDIFNGIYTNINLVAK